MGINTLGNFHQEDKETELPLDISFSQLYGEINIENHEDPGELVAAINDEISRSFSILRTLSREFANKNLIDNFNNTDPSVTPDIDKYIIDNKGIYPEHVNSVADVMQEVGSFFKKYPAEYFTGDNPFFIYIQEYRSIDRVTIESQISVKRNEINRFLYEFMEIQKLITSLLPILDMIISGDEPSGITEKTQWEHAHLLRDLCTAFNHPDNQLKLTTIATGIHKLKELMGSEGLIIE